MPVTEWDTGKLAGEVGRVATVKLGFPLRNGAQTEQLLRIAKGLSTDPGLPTVRLYEDAIRPSIERLGTGPLGTLARIEFGLTDESKETRFYHERLTHAEQYFHYAPNLLKAMSKSMREELARDLVRRWFAVQSDDVKYQREIGSSVTPRDSADALVLPGLDDVPIEWIEKKAEYDKGMEWLLESLDTDLKELAAKKGASEAALVNASACKDV
jgi:hypothetical protein